MQVNSLNLINQCFNIILKQFICHVLFNHLVGISHADEHVVLAKDCLVLLLIDAAIAVALEAVFQFQDLLALVV